VADWKLVACVLGDERPQLKTSRTSVRLYGFATNDVSPETTKTHERYAEEAKRRRRSFHVRFCLLFVDEITFETISAFRGILPSTRVPFYGRDQNGRRA